MHVPKIVIFILAVLAVILGVSLVIVFPWKKYLGDSAPRAPQFIKSNMIDLEYRQLFQLDIGKWGGGIGATDTELLVIAGDGQTRVVDLVSGEVHPSAIRLPENNEDAAVLAARLIEAEDRIDRGVSQVRKWMRYDDVLVFDDGDSLHLVLSYAYFDPEAACFSHRVSSLSAAASTRLQDLAASPGDWDLIFASQPCFGFRETGHVYAGVQSGGRLDLLDRQKGEFLLALGDYEFDGFKAPRYPQDPDADYGKVWKFNVRNGEQEVLAIGLRNTQGITVDSGGRIWTVEHGMQGGDELNLIVKGKNYGWPDVTLGVLYFTRPWPLSKNQGRHDGFAPPVYAWVPSVAVSNIDQSINFHPFWEGDLLAFSLKAQSIFRIRLHDDHVIMIERVPFNERIRYGFNHQQTGALFLWTDSGTLYEVTPSKQAWDLVERSRKAYEAVQQGLEITVATTPEILDDCLKCHTGAADSAPDLTGIIGRKISAGDYGNYSSALAESNRTWNRANLKAFLQNPQEFAPGTTMPDPMIGGDVTVEQTIDALGQLKTN